MKADLSASDVTRRTTRRFVIAAAAVAVLAFLAIAAGGINNNLVYYWTPKDLHAAGDKAYGATIRLGGMVAAGSVRRLGPAMVAFDVKDATGIVHVESSGAPPQMFREGIGVVVEGTMTRAGTFESHRLMVSHNNQYRAPKSGHPVDRKELEKVMRSTEGL